jgi:autophagy-related protein 18
VLFQINLIALCALSPSSTNCYLAYPATNASIGQLLIFDTLTLQALIIITCHKSPLNCIAFNYSGTMVATSSDRGTVIRVFDVKTGNQLHNFRRGTLQAHVISIAFALDDSLLSVSSTNDTVHIYKLQTQNLQSFLKLNKDQQQTNSTSAIISTLKSPLIAVKGVGSYLIPDYV